MKVSVSFNTSILQDLWLTRVYFFLSLFSVTTCTRNILVWFLIWLRFLHCMFAPKLSRHVLIPWSKHLIIFKYWTPLHQHFIQLWTTHQLGKVKWIRFVHSWTLILTTEYTKFKCSRRQMMSVTLFLNKNCDHLR